MEILSANMYVWRLDGLVRVDTLSGLIEYRQSTGLNLRGNLFEEQCSGVITKSDTCSTVKLCLALLLRVRDSNVDCIFIRTPAVAKLSMHTKCIGP
jgi:hypothetical protein